MPTRSSPAGSSPEGDDQAGALRLSVPGKLILMGEHAVVYRRPALVAALGLRLSVSLAAGDRPGVRIELPRLGFTGQAGWAEIAAHAERWRRRWLAWAADPTPERFAGLRGEGPDHLVRVALGEALREVAGAAAPGGDAPRDDGAPAPLPPLRLRIDSSIPPGAGFGSSSAMAVAVVAAVLRHHGVPADQDRVDRVALEVDRRQHGLPSGIDHRTVLRGGIVWARPGEPAREGPVVEPLEARPQTLAALRVFDTGAARESTGVVVAAVRERVRRDPRRHEALLDRMAEDTAELRRQLVAARPDPALVREVIGRFQRGLEELGVVPEPVRELVRRVEAAGGAAKISGAGSLSGPAAGCLLVYHPRPEAIEGQAFLAGLTRYPARLGVEGLRTEVA